MVGLRPSLRLENTGGQAARGTRLLGHFVFFNRLLILVELFGEPFRGGVAPGRFQGLPNAPFLGAGKLHEGGPPTPPVPAGRPENVRLGAEVRRLLLGRQLDHPPHLVRPKRSKNLTADPESRDGSCAPLRSPPAAQAPGYGIHRGHAIPPTTCCDGTLAILRQARMIPSLHGLHVILKSSPCRFAPLHDIIFHGVKALFA